MKTEVDLIQLAQAVSTAILQFAQPQPTITQKEINDLIDEERPKMLAEVKKKRGRPKKEKIEKTNNLKQVRKDSSFTAPTKLEDYESSKQRAGGGTYMKRVPFRKQKRVNQWVDDLNIAQADRFNKNGKKLVYPPHTEPRLSQKEFEYKCNICNRNFMAFPSYISGSADGESQPQIKCFDCNSRR